MTASTYSPTFLPSPYTQQGQQWQQGHEQINSTVHLVVQLLNSAQQQLFTAQQIIAQLAMQQQQQQPYQGWGQQPYQQYGQQFGQQQPYQQFWQQQQRPYAMSW